MSDVPDDAYLLAILPFPAWPFHAAPGPAYEGAAAPLTPETLALALDASFPCFGEAGFVLGPADDWETQPDLILPLSRADATIFAVYTHGGLFFTAMARGDADGTPLQQLRQAVRSHQQRATFGSFPLHQATYDALVAALKPIGDALGNLAGVELARNPIDLATLDQAMAVALHALQSRLRIQRLRADADTSWTEGRLKRVAEALTALASVAELTATERERLETAKVAVSADPPALARRPGEPAVAWYHRAVAVITAADLAFKASLTARASSRAGRVAWEDAVGHFHEALGALWEDVYGRIYVPLQAGDAAAVDPAIEFLEADLWYFRSGYIKEKLLRFLGRHQWTEQQRLRLEAVLVHRIRAGGGRELRYYYRLAPKLDRLRLLGVVRPLLADTDMHVARRALWFLPWLTPPPLPPGLIAGAQEVLLRIAAAPSLEYPVTVYLRASARAFWTNEFPTTLYKLMASDPENPAPYRLLSCASHPIPSAHRPMAQAWLLRAIDHGRETAWIERLAANAGDDALEAELRTRTDSPDDEMRQYARWALRAMGRLKG